MTRRDLEDVAELAARLAWHPDAPKLAPSPVGIAKLAIELYALERAWRRHCERSCSEEWYQSREAAVDERLRAKVLAWCREVPGAEVELEGDPRGAVMRVRLPGMLESVPV